MATEVKNGAGGDTGSSLNGRITVKSNRNETQSYDPADVDQYLIAKFDLKYTDTAVAIDGADLADRFDDPRYYQGDAVT